MSKNKTKKLSLGKRIGKSLSKKALQSVGSNIMKRIKNPPQVKEGKLSALAIMMIVSAFLIISLPIAQIISEDIFGYDLLKIDKMKKTENSGKSIYKIDQPDLSITDTDNGLSGLDMEDFESMGFEAQEAAIIQALEKIMGGWSPETINSYLGGLNPSYKADTIYKMLPGALAAHIKFGTMPGIIVSQSAAEQGWYYPQENKRSPSWKYNNPFGIKGSKNSATNEYWTGEVEVSATSEGWGSNTVNIKAGFRAYKTVWHACMDHSRLLGNERYSPFGLTSETDPYQYGYNLGVAGYYTDNKVSYANKMKGIYEGINGSKIDELGKLVKEEMLRSGTANLAPDGSVIGDDEFQTGGNEGFGPPLENLSNYRVSSWRGPRNTGIKGASTWHQAVDIAAPTGVKILAAKSGVVTQSQVRGSYGNLIEIKHDDGMYTRYAHASKRLVNVGDKVNKGDPVALVGNTGVGSGPHLHYEIRTKNDYAKENSVDTLKYYDKYKTGSNWHIKPKASQENTGSSSNNNNGTGSFVTGKLPSGSLSANMPKIEKKLITRNFTKKDSRSVEYIVIHDTGTYQSFGNANWIQNLFNTSARQASSHYGVDESTIMQYVEDKDVSYHAGKNIRSSSDPRSKVTNSSSIGIELCVNEGNDWNKTRQNGVALTAQLLIKYGLTPDKVYTHNDVSGKQCPWHMLGKYPGQWEDFKKAVEREYNLLKGVNNADKGTVETNNGGKKVKAEYTAYDPSVGDKDAQGNKINPDNLTCAAPKEIPFGTKITVEGTGTSEDGKTYTVTDRGGAIKVKSDGTYRIDLLMHNTKEANAFGRRKGSAIIGGKGGSNSSSGGNSSSGSNSNVSTNSRDKLTKEERIQIRRNIKKIFDEFGCQTDVNTLPDDRLKLINEIMKHQTRLNSNKKYRMGATGPDIFDCSGLQGYVYKNALGITLPRTSGSISTSSMFKKRNGLDDAVAGDIVWNPGHVAMYMGKTSDGKVLVMDAYSSGKPIEFRKVKATKGHKYLYPSEISSGKPSNVKPSTGGGGSTKPVNNLNNFVFVGDSFTSRLSNTIKSNNNNNVYVHAKGGSAPSYWIDKVPSMPDNSKVNGVVVLIGVNGASTDANKRDVKTLITALANKYPNKTIYVQKVFPTGKNFKSANPASFNKKIDTLNSIIESHCNTLGNVKFINTQSGFVDSNGYLIKTDDGLHINYSENQKFYDNILNAVKGAR